MISPKLTKSRKHENSKLALNEVEHAKPIQLIDSDTGTLVLTEQGYIGRRCLGNCARHFDAAWIRFTRNSDRVCPGCKCRVAMNERAEILRL